MYPNQPEQPQGYPPVQPQGATPPYPQQPAQPVQQMQPQAFGQPQQPYQQPYPPQPGQSAQPTYQQQYPQQTAPQPLQQAAQWAPQQPTQPQPYYADQPALVPEGMASIDYLEQIAAKPQNSGLFSRKQILLLGGLLLLAFGVLATFIATSGGSGPNITQQSLTLVSQTEALSDVAKKSQPNVKNQSLSNTNSAAGIQLTSTASTLATAFGEVGIATDKPPKEIVAATSNAKLLEKLEDARLSGTFDRVYAREMSYELQKILLLMNDVHTRTNNAELKKKLEESYKNIEPLERSFTKFDGATS